MYTSFTARDKNCVDISTKIKKIQILNVYKQLNKSQNGFVTSRLVINN